MWKLLIAFALLACAPLCGQPVLGQKPSASKKGTVEKPDRKADGNQGGKTDQRGTKEFPFIVDTEGHQQTEPEKKEATQKEDRTREVERWTLYFAQLTTWATVALVVIGFGGVIAATWTLRQIKRQANLMALPYLPWVDVNNWRWKPHGGIIGIGISGAEITSYSQLTVRVDVVNPTQYPMHLPAASIRLELDGIAYTCHFRKNCRLTPGNPETARFDITLSQSQSNRLMNGGEFMFVVEGDLSQVGALGAVESQTLNGLLWCGGGKGVRFETLSGEDKSSNWTSDGESEGWTTENEGKDQRPN